VLTPSLPLPVVLAALAVALSLPVLGWALFARPEAVAVQSRDNLLRGIALPTDSGTDGPGLLARLAGGLTPRGTVARLNRLAGTAGRPAAWPVPRLVAAKLVLALIAGALGLLAGIAGLFVARRARSAA